MELRASPMIEPSGSAAGHDVDDAVVALVPDEDAQRAALYRVLALYLGDVPDRERLAAASALAGDQTPIGRAVATFAHLAARVSPQAASDEFHELFIGVGRGELVPYASYYLTGFLHEKPLARLRQDMARLAIAADPDVKEPEDHIASVLEMMAGLIDGALGKPQPLAAQKAFFEAHVASWAAHFFRDLEGARAAVLYAPIGTIGCALMEIETEGFRMI